jgi:hypothetical protein
MIVRYVIQPWELGNRGYNLRVVRFLQYPTLDKNLRQHCHDSGKSSYFYPIMDIYLTGELLTPAQHIEPLGVVGETGRL